MVPCTNLPNIPESEAPAASETSGPDWEERDWEDYNYDVHADSSAHSGGRLGRDPFADLLNGLPGLDADAIAALIRNFPTRPNDVEVPGLTVEEAKEVMFHNTLYNKIYSLLYIVLYNMLSSMLHNTLYNML
jgi:hypothetical protein